MVICTQVPPPVCRFRQWIRNAFAAGALPADEAPATCRSNVITTTTPRSVDTLKHMQKRLARTGVGSSRAATPTDGAGTRLASPSRPDFVQVRCRRAGSRQRVYRHLVSTARRAAHQSTRLTNLAAPARAAIAAQDVSQRNSGAPACLDYDLGMRTDPRPRRYVPLPALILTRPVLRYSHSREAYVLRLVGTRPRPAPRSPGRPAGLRRAGTTPRPRAAAAARLTGPTQRPSPSRPADCEKLGWA